MSESIKKTLYRQVLAYAKPYRKRIAMAMFFSLGVAAVDGAMARLVQPFVDYVLVAKNRDMILLVPAFVVGLSVVKGVSRFLQNYHIRIAGQLAIQDLRNDAFTHLIASSMRFHLQTSSGDLMSCVLNDINMLAHMLSETLVNALREGVTLIALIGVAFFMDWQMALIAFTILPLAAIPAQLLAKKIKKFTKRGQAAIAILTTALDQGFSGIKVIKAFGTEKKVSDDFVEKNRTFFTLFSKSVKYDAMSLGVVEITTSFGVAGVLWLGMTRVADGLMTQGELLAVLTAIMMMYAPVKRLTRVNNVYHTAMAAAERVFEFINIQPEIKDRADAIDLPAVKGDVKLTDLTFSYGKGDSDAVIKNFDLAISSGEVIALVGPSGAGKTTLAGLLCRFYDPDKGSVSLDGIDLRDLSSSCLHRSVTMVDQEAFLFNETIFNNIGYGHETSEEAVREAARLAYADEFISDLPEGYQTNIGDRGLRLSGGQRQRISIARAICQDTPVLILDEATSALDTESEAIVQQAMQNLMQGRTTIVIAHRLSTIMNADRIVVMAGGEISEIGNHDQLLAKNGLYRKLYDMQFRDSE